MGRATTKTKLPLARWAALMGIHPLHFEGVYVRAPGVCEQPWMQYAWQAADRVSREDVAQAIAKAESDLEDQLHFRLLPDWEYNEWQPTARPSKAEYFNLYNRDVRGYDQTVKANWGYFISGGVKAKTLIDADAAIVWSDADGDGYEETGTVTATVAEGLSHCEIRLFYPGKSGEDVWEIRPVRVSVSGTTATITFRRELAVLESHTEAIVVPADDSHKRGVVGTEDANFLSEVDVYRVWNDPQTQLTMMWSQFASGCAVCSDGVCEHCAYSVQTGCLITRYDPRQSILTIRPGTWDADNTTFTTAAIAVHRSPDLARLYYYGGWEDKSQDCPKVRMDPKWETTVARLAAAYLERPICECNNARAYIERWQTNRTVQNESASYKITNDDLENPFGPTEGGIYAWHQIKGKDEQIAKAVPV